METEEIFTPRKANILVYDIETLPPLIAKFNVYDDKPPLWYHSHGLMASFAYKWLGQKTTHVHALPDYLPYKKDRYYDKELVRDLHKVFQQADIIIAHNGDSFDQKISKGRFLIHGFDAVDHYKQVDTLKVARKHFKLESNRLDALGEQLGLGRKLRTGGWELWHDCYYGDLKAWDKMKRYNKQDVVLLEKVYYKLRPWITNHPNLALIENSPDECPKCGSDKGFVLNGWHHTAVSKYRRLQCKNCKGNVQGKLNLGMKTRYK